MPIPKKFLHDKVALLLASANGFLAVLCVALVLLRFGNGHSGGYIVEYRSNLGIGAFKTGSGLEILAFAAFALGLAAVNIILSLRTYGLRRELSLAILSLGALVLLLAIIVSNALLVLS